MIPDKDYYIDASGKLTDDPLKFAAQVAVAGFFLDEGIARRYGITDTLVSVDEPSAVRRVRAKPEPEPEAVEEVSEPEAEPEAEEPKAAAAKPAAKKATNKGAKRK